MVVRGVSRVQAAFHWPELGHLVTPNYKGVWKMSRCVLRKRSQNALVHREPVSGTELGCEF